MRKIYLATIFQGMIGWAFGQSWLPVDPHAGQIKTLHFSNEDVGYVSSKTDGKCYKSNNGGRTWHGQTRPIPDLIFNGGSYLQSAEKFVSTTPDHVWAYGARNYVARSIDGGATWQADSVPYAHNGIGIQDIDFVDNFNGWICGTVSLLYKCSDGGHTWTAVNIPGVPQGDVYTAMDFFDSQTGVVGTQDGKCFKTTNGGNTWTQIFNADNNWIFDIQFVSATEAWMLAGQGILRHSTDGGSSWSTIDLGTTDYLYQFEMKGNKGIILGTQKLFKTDNAGATWADITSSETLGYKCVSVASEYRIFALTPDSLFVFDKCPNLILGSQTTGIVCGRPAAKLKGTVTPQSATIRWYANANDEIPVYEGLEFSTPNLTGAQTYYQEGYLKGCITANRNSFVATPQSVNTIVSLSEGILTSTAIESIYQWGTCLPNGDIESLAGKTQKDFIPSVIGSYALIITQDGCKDTSECIDVNDLSRYVGLQAINQTTRILTSPNPTKGKVQLNFTGIEAPEFVQLKNPLGQVVGELRNVKSTTTEMTIDGKDGLYFLEIVYPDRHLTYRIIKN